MTRKCYDKEKPPGHWDNGTNELLAPLTLVGRRGCPFGTTPRPVGMFTIPTLILLYLHETFDRNNWPFHQSLGHWVKAGKGSTLRMFHQVNWIYCSFKTYGRYFWVTVKISGIICQLHFCSISAACYRSISAACYRMLYILNPMPQWKTPPPLPGRCSARQWMRGAQPIGISAAKMGWLRDINT